MLEPRDSALGGTICCYVGKASVLGEKGLGGVDLYGDVFTSYLGHAAFTNGIGSLHRV